MAKHPGKYFLMGADPRLPKMPDKPTLIDFFKAAVRLDRAPAAERDACAQGRARRKDRPGLPPPRHRRGELHPLRSRLLGRAADRALCGRGGELGDARAPGAALLPRRIGRLQVPRHVRQVFRRRLPAGTLHRRRIRARPEPQVVHDGAPDLHQRHLLVRPECEGRPGRFRRHHRPQLQAAEGRAGLRQQPVGAYVAHA